MTVALDVLLFFHFVGLAGLLGGYLAQVPSRTWRIVPGMTHGALTQLVTGLGMAGIIESSASTGEPAQPVKWAVKLGVLVVILVLIWPNRRKEQVSPGVFQVIGLLTVVNIGIAVFWK